MVRSYRDIPVVNQLFTYAVQTAPLSDDDILAITKLLPLLEKLNKLVIAQNIINDEIKKICKTEYFEPAEPVNINMTINGGHRASLLLYAVSNNHLKYVMELIKAHADINQVAGSGMTALSFAIKERNLPMISLLLTHDAKIYSPNDHLMNKNSYDDLFQFLKTCDQNDPALLTSLQILCKQHSNFLQASTYLKEIQKLQSEINKNFDGASCATLFQNVTATKIESGDEKKPAKKRQRHK